MKPERGRRGDVGTGRPDDSRAFAVAPSPPRPVPLSPRPPIRLIVNADDFGLSESVNAAVLEAHDRGILTSCSLMVAEPAAGAAARAASQRPSLAVGLHVTAVCGRAVLPSSDVSELVSASGRFSDNPVTAGLRYAFSRKARAQLERELRAQFERFHELGLPLSHVDGHLHMHMNPFVFDRAAALAEEFGCRRIRIPRDNWSATLREDGVRALSQAPLAAIFALLARRAQRRLAGRGFLVADRVHGFFRTDRMDEAALLMLLRRLPPGLHEAYSHPDAGGRGAAGRAELAALVSPAVRRVLDERQILLTTYRDMEMPACR
jgi:hopanoid biosynthesis associated protein HpnK